VISAVLRSTIIQLSVPDRLRGRLAAIQIGVVQGGPRLGDLEAGAVGNAFGNEVSVVSGGLACIAGALLLSRLLPGFRTVEVGPGTVPIDPEPADPSPPILSRPMPISPRPISPRPISPRPRPVRRPRLARPTKPRRGPPASRASSQEAGPMSRFSRPVQ